jgi:hypothetical protein
MNPSKCNLIRKDLEALKWVFADIEKKFGVKVALGSASYTDSNVIFKLELNEVASDGTVLTREADAFKQLAPYYGLQASDFGRTFQMHGKTFKIVGLKSRAHKQPILAETDGKRYKFAAETVKGLLGLEKTVAAIAAIK